MYRNIDKEVWEEHRKSARALGMTLGDYIAYLEECEAMQTNMSDEERVRADEEWARSCHDVENHYRVTVGHCNWY